MTAPDQASPTGQDSPPTCYRHPGKETWVSCVRCGRYACPDCLREAAVGQQCVECVRGDGRTTRQPKTVFGGRPARSATVTLTLIAINVVIFLAEVAKPNLLYELGMLGTPAYTPAGPQAGVAGGEWYRLITSAFVAPGTSLGGLGLLDIALNMWILYLIGPELERLLGPVRYLAIYILSAVGGSVLYYYLQPHGFAAGASGAIFGLFGAWVVVSRRLRRDSRGILRLRAAQEPDCLPGGRHGYPRRHLGRRRRDQERAAQRLARRGYRHRVASTTPATISTKPQTRFHPPSVRSPGMFAWVT